MEKEIDSVFLITNYGFIRVKLSDVLKRRNISINRLATKSHVSYAVAKKWCGGKMAKIDADVLARFCHVLKCNVSDILEFVPQKETVGEGSEIK